MNRFNGSKRYRSRSPLRRWPTASKKKGGLSPSLDIPTPKWNIAELPKFEKCFYKEHPMSSARSKSEVESFRSFHKMTLYGDSIPNPVLSFCELHLPDYIIGVIMKNGWQNPTPIQSQGWPMALSGRDVVGIAQTGSGKTATFLVPALVHIASQPRLAHNDGPICLVLVPTRELAQQVLTVAEEFTAAAGMRTMCFYGGSSRGPQLRALQKGAEICIATPGRLIDFLSQNRIGRITVLVATDVASRGLDIDDIEYVVNFDFPNQSEDYIHRIGRTARSDKKGTAYTFFTSKNMRQAKDLVEILREANQEIPPDLLAMSGLSNMRNSSYGRKGSSAFERKSSGRFSKPPMNPTFTNPSSFSNHGVRQPNMTSFDNGSSLMLKSNSASANLHSLQHNTFKTPSNEPFTGGHESVVNNGLSASLNFGAAATPVNKDFRGSESSFVKTNPPNFGKSVPSMAGFPTSGDRWEGPAEKVDGKNSASCVPVASRQPYGNPTDPAWSANSWGDSVNKFRPKWTNPAPDNFQPSNGTVAPRAPNPNLVRPGRPDQQIPIRPLVNSVVETIRPKAPGLLNAAAPAAQSFAQPWPGFAPNTYQNIPPFNIDQPKPPGWGPGWGQTYPRKY